MHKNLPSRDKDVMLGKQRMMQIHQDLNIHFLKIGCPYTIGFCHQADQLKSLYEKGETNKIRNYESGVSSYEAMGFLSCIKSINSTKIIVLKIFRMDDSVGNYIKLPGEFIENPQGYWQHVILQNYYYMTYNQQLKKSSRIIHAFEFYKLISDPRWHGRGWWMGDEKHNKNRMNISGVFLSSIDQFSLGDFNFDVPSIHIQISNIFNIT